MGPGTAMVAGPVAAGAGMILATSPTPHALDLPASVALIRFDGGESDRPRLAPADLAPLAASLHHAAATAAVVILAGGDRAFCLGADLDWLRQASPAMAAAYLQAGRDLIDQLAALPVPVIAAVNGLALGGGFELAMACDFCWAAPRSVFALPEGRQRLVPAWGAFSLLHRRVPPATAWELLAGRRIGARRAWALGLVGRVIDGPDFMARVGAAAAEVAGCGRTTLAALKQAWRSVNQGEGDALALRKCLERLAAAERER